MIFLNTHQNFLGLDYSWDKARPDPIASKIASSPDTLYKLQTPREFRCVSTKISEHLATTKSLTPLANFCLTAATLRGGDSIRTLATTVCFPPLDLYVSVSFNFPTSILSPFFVFSIRDSFWFRDGGLSCRGVLITSILLRQCCFFL